MPTYLFASTCGLAVEQVRTVAERATILPCPDCAGLLRRDFAREVSTITINHTPLNFFTQWGDLYDVSPHEMARRGDVERYDPTLRHKPTQQPVNLRKHLPSGVHDVDTLVKAIAPVDGRHETDKMLQRVSPLPEEQAY